MTEKIIKLLFTLAVGIMWIVSGYQVFVIEKHSTSLLFFALTTGWFFSLRKL